jgi:hypothetical protein
VNIVDIVSGSVGFLSNGISTPLRK